MRTQLCELERRTARGGRDSVDHAAGGHDDVANAVRRGMSDEAWTFSASPGLPGVTRSRQILPTISSIDCAMTGLARLIAGAITQR
jgi:hypothetical protein